MAVAELVPYTSGRADSTEQTVADGSFHTIIPRFNGSFGKVTVSLVDSDGNLWLIKTLSGRDTKQDENQIRGPATYVVSVRNAGADLVT